LAVSATVFEILTLKAGKTLSKNKAYTVHNGDNGSPEDESVIVLVVKYSRCHISMHAHTQIYYVSYF